MKLKNPPKSQGKVVPVTPVFLLLKEAHIYTGMKGDTFRKVALEYGLRTYAIGRKKMA